MPMDPSKTIEILASKYFPGYTNPGGPLDILWESAVAERSGTVGPVSVSDYLRQTMKGVNYGRTQPLTDVILRYDDGRAMHAWRRENGEWTAAIVAEGPLPKASTGGVLRGSDDWFARFGEVDEHLDRAGNAADRLRHGRTRRS